ncbi:beta-lactamase [Halostagnicola larsenii XH-48]|uniref:Beta-lactamase n=1 Tax=Halostagnicola larsenii XH-48 TaxID=797299 RepID=W0JP94_9EURY|nr:serine hydrolase domain-containing protein [Halostagnicola larsenii]AHF98792.1 beta-lactamase [Halostagnicola larsenii XH-48]
MSNPRSRRRVLAGSALLGAASITGRVPQNGRAASDTDAPNQSDEPDSVSPSSGRSRSLELQELDDLESFVDETMRRNLEEHDVVGASVAVVHDDEIVFADGYGDASIDGSAVDAAETRFRVGSVSKPIVWTAVMQLIEAGSIDPDEDIRTYLESVPLPETEWEPITMAHLATHTAGFEQRYGGTWVRDPDDVRSLPTVLSEEQPERVRPPGSIVSYSNYGAALAAQVVADVTGTPFERYVRENVFDPLGMDTATFEQPVPDEPGTDVATGYTTLTGTPTESPGLHFEFAPAGSMSTTATEMGQFVRAHLNGGVVDGDRILEEETVEEMHDRWFTHHERLDGLSFGLLERSRGTGGSANDESTSETSSDDDESTGGESRLLEHDGQIPGSFHSRLLLAPEHDLGLFLAYNTDSAAGAGTDFIDAFLEEYLPLEESAEDAVPDSDGRPERADELEGSYRGVSISESEPAKFWSVAQAGSVDVSVADDGALVTEVGGETRWIEREPLLFQREDGDDFLAFGEDGGEIRYLFLGFQAFERRSWHESMSVHAGVAGATTLGMLSGAVGWPLARGWRWLRSDGDSGAGSHAESDAAIETGSDDPRPSNADSSSVVESVGRTDASGASGGQTRQTRQSGSSREAKRTTRSNSLSDPRRWGRWTAGGTIACLFGFVLGVFGLLLVYPYTLLSDPPLAFEVLFVLPLLGIAGTAVSAFYAVTAWREGYWSRRSRIHYTLVVCAMAGFCWLLYYWNFVRLPV